MESPDADTTFSQELELFGPDLERTIRFARLRCIPRHEVIERVLTFENLDYEQLDAYAFRLAELKLTPAELRFIAASMTEVARKTESASPEVKGIVDKALFRLLRLLPTTLANKFARPYLDHKRKGRRRWAYFTLRGERISQRNAGKLAKVFRETKDKAILGSLTRTPECVHLLGARFLLDRLKGKDEAHWRGRVLECLLTYDRSEAIGLASQFPWEFLYAAGRSGDSSLLPIVQSLFKSTSATRDFVSIYAWCLGKLGANEEIDDLERFVREDWCRPSSPLGVK
jgi:hypothetical protein